MKKRYIAIWFRHLTTDRMIRRQPGLKDIPFVLAAPEHGRMVVKAANIPAESEGIHPGMAVADCRAIMPSLQVFDDQPGQESKLLQSLAEWCIRFTPVVAVDRPDGLLLDVSGCAHLWGGEKSYLKEIVNRLTGFGYDIYAALADTIGCAWAFSRFGQSNTIIESGKQIEALMPLPVKALRIEKNIIERLEKLGLYQVHHIIGMPRAALRRRFGISLLSRLDQALGQAMETIEAVCPEEPFCERLPCLEPILTATGIEIALEMLMQKLCERLEKESKGLRNCVLKYYRVDGNIQQVSITTGRASRNKKHLLKLFEPKITLIEPDSGIELFILEASVTEDLTSQQEALWNLSQNGNDQEVAELLDRVADRAGADVIRRYLPQEYYWPERSVKPAISLEEKPATAWRTDLPRPVHLLSRPEPIEVTVPIPDYPPMLFRYKGVLHKVVKADGPERIEQEWWLQQGQPRDYYCVEDENGGRYWLFRSGHYDSGNPQWFVHGLFA